MIQEAKFTLPCVLRIICCFQSSARSETGRSAYALRGVCSFFSLQSARRLTQGPKTYEPWRRRADARAFFRRPRALLLRLPAVLRDVRVACRCPRSVPALLRFQRSDRGVAVRDALHQLEGQARASTRPRRPWPRRCAASQTARRACPCSTPSPLAATRTTTVNGVVPDVRSCGEGQEGQRVRQYHHEPTNTSHFWEIPAKALAEHGYFTKTTERKSITLYGCPRGQAAQPECLLQGGHVDERLRHWGAQARIKKKKKFLRACFQKGHCFFVVIVVPNAADVG